MSTTSNKIRKRLIDNDQRFHAGDNISNAIEEGELDELIAEATVAFQGVLQTLVIDTDKDPNSKGTAKRLAKMYINELMAGRYQPRPDVTAFPNIDNHHTSKYQGMLVIRAEIRSMCSHHHQPVIGTAYIGILPSDKVIGLSKYARIAQWCARRGTLQEELVQDIMHEIQKATDARDVAVHIEGRHGCMENRGVMAHSSLTQTTALSGQFFNDSIKREFFANVQMQKMG